MESLTTRDHGDGPVTLSLLDEVVATQRPEVPSHDRRQKHAVPPSPRPSTSALGLFNHQRSDAPKSPRVPKSPRGLKSPRTPRLPLTLTTQLSPRKEVQVMEESSVDEEQSPLHVKKHKHSSWTIIPPPMVIPADEPPTVIVVERHSAPSSPTRPPRASHTADLINTAAQLILKSLEGERKRRKPPPPPVPPKPAALRTSSALSPRPPPTTPPKTPKLTAPQWSAEEELLQLRVLITRQQIEIEELKLTQSVWRIAQDKGLFERTAEERREKSMELLAAEQKQTETMADTIERQMDLIKRQGDIMAQQDEVITGLELERDEFEDERDELEEERDELGVEVEELRKVNESLIRELEEARRLGGGVSVKSFDPISQTSQFDMSPSLSPDTSSDRTPAFKEIHHFYPTPKGHWQCNLCPVNSSSPTMNLDKALKHERGASHRELASAAAGWINPVAIASDWELSPELANWGSGKIQSFRSYTLEEDDPWVNPLTVKIDRWRGAILGEWKSGLHNFEREAVWTEDEVASSSRHPHYYHLADEDAKRLTLARKQHKIPPVKQRRNVNTPAPRSIALFDSGWVENFIRTREDAIRQHQEDYPGRSNLADRPDLMRDRAKLRSFAQLSFNAKEKAVIASINSLALVMRRLQFTPQRREPLGPSTRNAPSQQKPESSLPRANPKKRLARK